MANIDDQLADLLGKNADLYAAYEVWANGQIMLLAGTIDDPQSFDAAGGKAGALGYYPIVDVSGVTRYVPCLARLRAIAREVPDQRYLADNALAAVGDVISADTSARAWTLRLPAEGGSVTVRDHAGTWGTRPVTIDGNGRTIDGRPTFAADASRYSIIFTSAGATWRYQLAYQYGA